MSHVAKLTIDDSKKAVSIGLLEDVLLDGFKLIDTSEARQHLLDRLKLVHQKLVNAEPGGAWHNPMSKS